MCEERDGEENFFTIVDGEWEGKINVEMLVVRPSGADAEVLLTWNWILKFLKIYVMMLQWRGTC